MNASQMCKIHYNTVTKQCKPIEGHMTSDLTCVRQTPAVFICAQHTAETVSELIQIHF